jgi:UDP-3-O-[3-hydroxymyristoyl] N-acetylglucosamine deacetylase
MSSLRDRYSFQQDGLMQRRTLKTAISAVGHGLHGGVDVTLRLVPAEPGVGIVFRRTDLGVDVPALFDRVNDTRLCTVVSEGAARVGTVEHLMAALSASGIDDLVVELDAPELPIFDGSAEPFLFLIESAGIVEQGALRARLEILRTVRVTQGDAFAELRPNAGGGFEVALAIEFAAGAIGAQAFTMTVTADGFAKEIAPARTFAMAAEIEALRAAGLAKGGSLANAIVVDGDVVVNPEGLRFADEFVRHKMLDVIGDLALAGAPIVGKFSGFKTGHALNNKLLRAVFADQANYRVTNAGVVPVLEMSAA